MKISTFGLGQTLILECVVNVTRKPINDHCVLHLIKCYEPLAQSKNDCGTE